MLQKLKSYSARKPLKAYLNNRSKKSASGRIGIIFDPDIFDPGSDVADLLKELNFREEACNIILFSNKNSVRQIDEQAWFNGKNLAWNGKFATGSKEEEFAQTGFDLLLNYFVDPSHELLILSASAKASLKVGFPLEEKRLNDFEIAVDPKDYRLFAKELKKYLPTLKIKP